MLQLGRAIETMARLPWLRMAQLKIADDAGSHETYRLTSIVEATLSKTRHEPTLSRIIAFPELLNC